MPMAPVDITTELKVYAGTSGVLATDLTRRSRNHRQSHWNHR